MPGKTLKPTPLTYSDLLRFFTEIVKPELGQLVAKDEFQSYRSEIFARLDDLYKKFEDLRQEYIIANQQMKRLEKSDELLREEIASLKSKVLVLQGKIDELEKELTSH